MKKFIILALFIFFTQIECLAQTINIAFTIDNNYQLFTKIAIFSILENNYSKNDYNFFIVYDNLSEKNKEKMRDFIKSRGQNIQFIQVSTDKIDNGENVYKYLDNRITRIGMARILLPEVLPKNIHRVIYLDSDIIVSDDISELYNTDLKGKSTGMMYDAIATNNWAKKVKKNLKLAHTLKPENYYNSGVILMDLDKWRKEDLTEQLISYYKQNKNSESLYKLPDQDLLSIVLKNNVTILPQKWNNQTGLVACQVFELKGLHHYVSGIKPWYFIKSNTKAYNLYYEYWYKSPFKIWKYYYYLKSFNIIYIYNLKRIYCNIRLNIHFLMDNNITPFYVRTYFNKN